MAIASPPRRDARSEEKEVELEVAYAAADDEVDDLRDRIDQLLELVRDSDKELEQLRSRSETAAALAGVEKTDAEKASDDEAEAVLASPGGFAALVGGCGDLPARPVFS